MKLLWPLLLSMCAVTACRNDPLPVSPPMDFDKITPDHSLSAFGGTLLGHDRGEWGGRLAFRDPAGKISEIFRENVQAIVLRGEHVVVFTGLAHLGDNEGAIYLLSPDKAHGFRVRGLYVLEGQPQRITVETDTGAIRFAVFTEKRDARIEQNGWVDVCRRLDIEYSLSTLTSCDD